MNKRTIIAGLVVLALALAAFFALRSSPGAATLPVTATSTPAFATTLAPDMMHTAAGSTLAEPVVSPTKVSVGDTLTTSHNGRGLLQEANGTATLLDYDTTLTLAEDDGTGTHVTGTLGAGAMWARVEKVFGKGEYYKIKTQNAVAIVRGTSFGVSYLGGISTLLVATGTVVFMPVDPATGAALESKEAFVSAGNKGVIDQSGIVHVSPLSAADKKSPWYLYNVPTNAPTPVPPSSTKTPTLPPATVTPPATTPPPTSSGGHTSSTPAPQPSQLTLTSLSASSVTQGDSVTLYGSGFYHVTTVNYGGTPLVRSAFTIKSDTTIVVNTTSIPAGTYDIKLDDATDATATLRRALTVNAPPPPTDGTGTGSASGAVYYPNGQ